MYVVMENVQELLHPSQRKLLVERFLLMCPEWCTTCIQGDANGDANGLWLVSGANHYDYHLYYFKEQSLSLSLRCQSLSVSLFQLAIIVIITGSDAAAADSEISHIPF